MNPRRDLLSLAAGKLLGYGQGLGDIAETYLSSLASTAARVAKLRAALAALQDDHNAWAADAREQREATSARNAELKAGRDLYRQVLKSAQVAVKEGEGGEGLISLVGGSPAPSSLTAATAFLAFEDLARGVEAHIAAFGTVDVTLEDAARLRAHGLALQEAANRLIRSNQERGAASGRRKGSREALTAQIRVMEEFLRARLSDADGIDALSSHRATFLPRYARKSKGSPVEPSS